jgi:GTP-binding protein
LPEFAFVGRSNVGKSSLLNALVGQKGLAHTSRTPGRTQMVNFFRIDDRWQFVDLPGYGFARAPDSVTSTWRQLVESYLKGRTCLAACFLLVDSRRGWMEMDLEMKLWLESRGIRYLVVATKFDKLKSQSERHHALKRLEEGCPREFVVPFSAVTGMGVAEIWRAVRG